MYMQICIAVILLVIAYTKTQFFVYLKKRIEFNLELPPQPSQPTLPPGIRVLIGYVYLSLTTPSGKGYATSEAKAIAKLRALQAFPPLIASVDRKDIANLRRTLLEGVEKTSFMQCNVVYVAGEDRSATARIIQRLLPDATVTLM